MSFLFKNLSLLDPRWKEARAGYEVLIANRVSEGLRLFENEDIDAVVLDYYMPEMNGDHVAEMMKRHRPDVPIVMLSAFVTVPQNVTANTDAFVVKGDVMIVRVVNGALEDCEVRPCASIQRRSLPSVPRSPNPRSKTSPTERKSCTPLAGV